MISVRAAHDVYKVEFVRVACNEDVRNKGDERRVGYHGV